MQPPFSDSRFTILGKARLDSISVCTAPSLARSLVHYYHHPPPRFEIRDSRFVILAVTYSYPQACHDYARLRRTSAASSRPYLALTPSLSCCPRPTDLLSILTALTIKSLPPPHLRLQFHPTASRTLPLFSLSQLHLAANHLSYHRRSSANAFQPSHSNSPSPSPLLQSSLPSEHLTTQSLSDSSSVLSPKSCDPRHSLYSSRSPQHGQSNLSFPALGAINSQAFQGAPHVQTPWQVQRMVRNTQSRRRFAFDTDPIYPQRAHRSSRHAHPLFSLFPLARTSLVTFASTPFASLDHSILAPSAFARAFCIRPSQCIAKGRSPSLVRSRWRSGQPRSLP